MSCQRCQHAASSRRTCSHVGELRLFDPGPPTGTMIRDGADLAPSDWPPPVAGGLGRPGFWYQDAPAIFGARRGAGPLVVAPDTNILISMHENLALVEERIGLLWGPIVDGDWPTVPDAIRDLLSVWWWRDLRFWVDPDILLRDARNGKMREDRAAARRRTVRAWADDFWARGGLDIFAEAWDATEPEAWGHPRPTDARWFRAPGFEEPRWPRSALDERLVRSAFEAGCQVFLTEDRDVLRCHKSLFPLGMAVRRPRDLLADLDTANELAVIQGPDSPSPDLQGLATFYALLSPDDALARDREELARPPSTSGASAYDPERPSS